MRAWGRRSSRPAPPRSSHDDGLPAAAEAWDVGLLALTLLRILLAAVRGLGRVGTLAELDREGLGGAVAGDLDLDGVADLVLIDERRQRGRVRDGLAAERRDPVADLQAA